MGSAEEPGQFDCYMSAEPNEPTFTLLARDPEAPGVIETWATLREARGENPAKVAEARACAARMRTWRLDNRKPVASQDAPCGTCVYCGQPRDIMAHEPGAASGHPWQPCCLQRSAHSANAAIVDGDDHGNGECIGWSPMPTTQPTRLDPGYEIRVKEQDESASDKLKRYAFAVAAGKPEEARLIAGCAKEFLELLRAAAPRDYDALIAAAREVK